jgi:hypothetical protein
MIFGKQKRRTFTDVKVRCYMEFCCNPASLNVHDYGDGESGPYDPANPVYEYRGWWGWCTQHRPKHRADD